MSQEQLVAAYLGGRMSRRTLIRRLGAAGVSLGGAVAYAHALKPARASARQLRGQHFDGSVEILDTDLDRVIAKKGLRIRATVDRGNALSVEVRLLRNPEKTPYPDAMVGSWGLQFDAPGSETVRIPFDANPPHSLRAVKRQRKRARFEVRATAYGGETGESVQTFSTFKTISR